MINFEVANTFSLMLSLTKPLMSLQESCLTESASLANGLGLTPSKAPRRVRCSVMRACSFVFFSFFFSLEEGISLFPSNTTSCIRTLALRLTSILIFTPPLLRVSATCTALTSVLRKPFLEKNFLTDSSVLRIMASFTIFPLIRVSSSLRADSRDRLIPVK